MATKGGLGRGLNKGMGIDSLITPKKQTKPTGSTNKFIKNKTANTQNTKKIDAADTVETRNDKKEKDVLNSEIKIDISLVMPNRKQPRKIFDKEMLSELSESIKTYGIISPIIVRKSGSFYEIIAGERRWRAARIAGLKEVPVIVRDYDEQRSAEISLIENIQRENLNPVEEARAYKRLIDEFALKQEEIAGRVSKSRVYITNTMRLLKLDARVLRMLEDNLISAGHARAILALQDKDEQYEAAQKAFHNSLSVRDTEKLVRSYGKRVVKAEEKDSESESVKAAYEEMCKGLREALGTKVNINRKNNTSGKLEIFFNSVGELESIGALLLKNK